MNILVFNCGSSSLNYKVFSGAGTQISVLARGKAHRVGVKGSEPAYIEHHQQGVIEKAVTEIPDHRTAAGLVLDFLAANCFPVNAIGHRFVHGGQKFQRTTLLDEEILAGLQACLPLAPIHNPNSMSVIDVCRTRLPDFPEFVTFDTAFHASMPEWSYRYALPAELTENRGLRKFGFHGLSYQYVTKIAAEALKRPLSELNLVACHLGTGGSSVAAIYRGQSIETSMGYSPLAGLMMSTRTGDLDALLPLYLMEAQGLDAGALSDLFNKQSGLIGVSGTSSDIRDLIRLAENFKPEEFTPPAFDSVEGRAWLAVEMYTYRLKKMIGAYVTLLGGVDALIFTDDIGVQNPLVRQKACAGLEWCGFQLDPAANAAAPNGCLADLSTPQSRGRIFSIPTDEELVIGQEGFSLLREARHAGF